MNTDDHDRTHYLVRDLEDDLPDLDQRDTAYSPTYGDETREPSYAPGDQTDAQPEPDAPQQARPTREGRRRRDPLANCVQAALPERSRARGIAAVIVVFCDGRKVVMR